MRRLVERMNRGPKPRQITDELLDQVAQLAARGLSQKQVCDALGFSQSWWHSKKAETQELGEYYKRGAAKGIAEVTHALFENALTGNVAAQIFFLKNRSSETWADIQQQKIFMVS